MQTFKKISLINTYNEKRYLIDYANIQQGLISNQKTFLSEKKLISYYKNLSKGFPLVLPIGLKCFDYKEVKKAEVADETDASGVHRPRSLSRWIYNRRAAVLPTTRARGRRAALQNMLMDVVLYLVNDLINKLLFLSIICYKRFFFLAGFMNIINIFTMKIL